MRRAQLVDHVQECLVKYLDDDVATAAIECEAYESLCQVLNDAAGGEADDIDTWVGRVADALSDYDLDWMVGDTFNGEQAEKPAAFLITKVHAISS